VFRPAVLGLLALTVAACSPGLPAGVSQERLDEAVSSAIGDPASCLLIGEAGSGRVVYRYNTNVACGRELPSCEGARTQTTGDLLKATARDGLARQQSCDTLADGSRGVGWASGPVAGRPLVYAAMMEGERAFPGLMMAERLARAFKRAGL